MITTTTVPYLRLDAKQQTISQYNEVCISFIPNNQWWAILTCCTPRLRNYVNNNGVLTGLEVN